MASVYRSVCMRLGFMAQDAPHLQFAANKCCRLMSVPTHGGWARLKRVARFLVRRGRCVQHFEMQRQAVHLDVFTDSDYAGDMVERRSTSACYVMAGKHMIRSSTSTQSVIALSSGEAEFAALVKGATIAIGVRSFAQDLGRGFRIKMHTDSSAARGVALRKGIGRLRHLHTPLLWLQERVAKRDMEVFKCRGDQNIADLGTKDLGREKMEGFLKMIGFHFEEGRHQMALDAAIDEN
eukprot:6483429-Amphidinium_carterae.1